MTWHSIALVGTVMAAGVVGGACHKKTQDLPDEWVTVVIDNQNFYDATVYLRWYSDRRRLGQVGGFSKKEFETRWVGPQVQVEVDLLAGGTYRGDQISVSPGETVIVELPPNLDRLQTRIGASFVTKPGSNEGH